ncbi:MAG: hypothetical protein IPQ07_18235 [Myxococcales bacterium]|nr:hypothetical protein [Myxococcales bacterium]
MSILGHRHDKKHADQEKEADQAASEAGASEAVADGMISASGGNTGKLASIIVEHRMQRDRRLWTFLHRKLGNDKATEVQAEVEATPAEPKPVDAKPAAADYKAFCAAFATSFAGVMSVFPGGMTEATVPQYFTAGQVAALSGFMASNVVPPDLFHQASGPNLTAQQRILLAGVILAHGTLPPELQGKVNLSRDPLKDEKGNESKTGQHDNRLHASMCGAWAQQVYLYAGAGIAAQNQQANQTVDTGGTLHLGNATTEKTFGSHADKTGLPLVGKQKEAKEAQDAAEAEGRAEAAAAGKPYVVPEKHQDFNRKAEMGAEVFKTLQPGDWIYIYNANTSATGQHSEIFIGWADTGVQTDKASGVQYRTANVMSQLQVEDGGKVHRQKLGSAHAPGIAPVTAITRVTEDSGELLDAHSLVAADAVEKNAKIIEDHKLDAAQFQRDLLKVANKELASLVSKKLDAKQREVFEKALAEATSSQSPEALALLVALVQRMDLTTGGVFKGRPANGIIDELMLAKKKSKK